MSHDSNKLRAMVHTRRMVMQSQLLSKAARRVLMMSFHYQRGSVALPQQCPFAFPVQIASEKESPEKPMARTLLNRRA